MNIAHIDKASDTQHVHQLYILFLLQIPHFLDLDHINHLFVNKFSFLDIEMEKFQSLINLSLLTLVFA